MPRPPQNLREFKGLVTIIEALRGPDGCPWDKEQTHSSLTRFAIEEAHELAEAIDSDSPVEIKSELGDLLLQVLLHAQIASEVGRFDISDVIETLSEKMVRRHPHVFSNVEVADANEVTQNWETIKANENSGKRKNTEEFTFDLPKGLPSLLASFKIGEKTKKYNFDWQAPADVFAKVEEELQETKEALAQRDKNMLSHEIGDLLFSVAQLARHLEIDPEQALRTTNRRFETRFSTMIKIAKTNHQDFKSLNSEELEELWQKAKLVVD